MPGRFPLTPVPLTSDAFCVDGFCGGPPLFDPSIYDYVRWVGTATYALGDQLSGTPYYQTTNLYTGLWTLMNTVGGVKSIPVMLVESPYNIMSPVGFAAPWVASNKYSFNPSTYPTNRIGSFAFIRKYNPTNGYTDIMSVQTNLACGISPGYTPGNSVDICTTGVYRPLIEWGEDLLTFTGVYEFSNDASTVLATWNGL